MRKKILGTSFQELPASGRVAIETCVLNLNQKGHAYTRAARWKIPAQEFIVRRNRFPVSPGDSGVRGRQRQRIPKEIDFVPVLHPARSFSN
jgi:hypothetical protein